jgi:3-hydroxyisobutyrate dehydrogenase-like beta-hydroxyacid dehydrogenase
LINALNSSDLCDNYLEQSYIHLKILCIEQVKRAGKDHSRLFELIQESQLSIRMRQFLLKELVYEAQRFKRSNLVQAMMKYANLLQQLAQATNSIILANQNSVTTIKSE